FGFSPVKGLEPIDIDTRLRPRPNAAFALDKNIATGCLVEVCFPCPPREDFLLQPFWINPSLLQLRDLAWRQLLILYATSAAAASAAASRSAAFFVFAASARSMIACIPSALMASPFATVKCTLSRMVRKARTSASRVSSITLGLRPSARSGHTSRTHSPSVMPSPSATAASLSYSLSVILQPTVRVRGWSAGIGKGLRGDR